MLRILNLNLFHDNIYFLIGLIKLIEEFGIFTKIKCNNNCLPFQQRGDSTEGHCYIFFDESDFIEKINEYCNSEPKSGSPLKVLVVCKKRNIHLVQYMACIASIKTGMHIVCTENLDGFNLLRKIRSWLIASKHHRTALNILRLSELQFSALTLRLKGFSSFEISLILCRDTKCVLNAISVAIGKLGLADFNKFYIDFYSVHDIIMYYLSCGFLSFNGLSKYNQHTSEKTKHCYGLTL